MWYTFSSGPEVPAMMGRAGRLVCLALPWSSGTGGTSLRGWVRVQSGRAMPCFAIKITSGSACPELAGATHEKTDKKNAHTVREVIMSGLLLTIAVDNAAAGKAIGVKEAIAMDLEKYGDVRVLRVEVREAEQIKMGGKSI